MCVRAHMCVEILRTHTRSERVVENVSHQQQERQQDRSSKNQGQCTCAHCAIHVTSLQTETHIVSCFWPAASDYPALIHILKCPSVAQK